MRWRYEDIDYTKANKKALDKEFLFFLVTSASFIEITSNIYAKNLIKFYKEYEDITNWLENVWEVEEIQHGKALKKYINEVWSEFNWQEAYDKFTKEYIPLCTLDEFQPTKAKEMLARVVVETGTSTFYRALEKFMQDLNEPVLKEIAHNISKDEIYHYEKFYEAFEFFNKKEKLNRNDIIKVIYQRLKMVDSEDGKLAFKAIYETLYKKPFKDELYQEHKKEVSKFAKKYYPYNMAIKMLLKPLKLNKNIEKMSVPVIRSGLKILGI